MSVSGILKLSAIFRVLLKIIFFLKRGLLRHSSLSTLFSDNNLKYCQFFVLASNDKIGEPWSSHTSADDDLCFKSYELSLTFDIVLIVKSVRCVTSRIIV